MKIIISHDVDHLYASDHIFRDLILEKLWIRSFIYFCRGRISFRTLLNRLTILFHNRMHRIDEIMRFDMEHGIPSVFFFGMANGLGMSYPVKRAVPEIRKVMERGFDAGVHGIEYENADQIRQEHDLFAEISGRKAFGIRNHYVRYNKDTFIKMDQAGYVFDSTVYNKREAELLPPYKVGDMWEFPLHIMDGYICEPGRVEEGIENTINTIRKADEIGLPYCTILFHEYQFDDRFDPQLKKWYEKTIEFCEKNGYGFISYIDAIKELEESRCE